jgi:uncharacterized protein
VAPHVAVGAAAEVVVAAAADPSSDRVGIGWRPELAAGILVNLHHIDLVEVMADDLFGARRNELRAIQTLATQTCVVLHGVSLGLASSAEVDGRRLDQMARVVNIVRPSFWSEHLAFVRGGGREIGHLAAPPRTAATIEGTLRNARRATRVVGQAPLLENIATLIDPPGSTSDEPTWISHIIAGSGSELLLDLNNLYANGLNFGHDPLKLLERLPLERVGAIHLAGGRWIRAASGEQRLLDDHLHDVPGAVYDLLSEVAARVARPLTVVLERDGAYPPFEQLLAQIRRAREALSTGRLRAIRRQVVSVASSSVQAGNDPAALEAYLAQLFIDADARHAFLAAPCRAATLAGLDAATCEGLARIDRIGLELASRSIAAKRSLGPPCHAEAHRPRRGEVEST